MAWLAFLLTVAWWPYPTRFQQMQSPATLLEDRVGAPLAAFVAVDGQWRFPLAEKEISPHLLDAIVAVEDSRYFAHRGVDWESAAGALVDDATHARIKRGASTITMQLQRLRDPRPRSFFNKFEQAIRATQLEMKLSKRQVLVEYLNRAPFGGNLVGAGAASWRYFGRPCSQLSLEEAATLAGLPQAPSRLRPDRFPQQARIRRDHVLDRMLACGMIDRGQHDQAIAAPMNATWRSLPQDRDRSAPADGALPTLIALANSSTHGVVRTSFDAGVQKQAALAAIEHQHRLASFGVSAAAVVVLDTRTDECLAAVSLGEAGQAIDLTRSARSTGSTLKPFIYAAAFEAGICTPRTVLDDSPVAWAGYTPADYDRRFRGPVSAAEALADSRNIPAMRVLADVGVERALGVMEAMGLKSLELRPDSYGLSLAVGGAEASPMELARAYAMLARRGVEPEQPGNLPLHASALSESACLQTLDAISGTDRTTAVCPEAAKLFVAWKTGTSSGHRDAWCAATTPRRTVVVWLGNAGGKASGALVGQEAAAPLALRLIAALDVGPGAPWPTADPGWRDQSSVALAASLRQPRQAAISLVSPLRGQQILLNNDLPLAKQRVKLAAFYQHPAGSDLLWWFVDNQPVGHAPAAMAQWWQPVAGSHEVRVVDGLGHAASARITVK